MRILQVVPYFYPAWSYGGPAKLVFDTSMELQRRGHDVIVYTSDAYNATHRMPIKKRISNLSVHYYRNLSNSLAFKANAYLPIGLFFRTPFELFRFDVIHIHDFYTVANIWISLWARLYKVPYILSVHGCLEAERRQQKSLFKKLFLRLYGISMLQSAALVVATSDNEEKAYKELGIRKKKISRLGHGVRAEEFVTKKSKDSCRKELSISKDRVVFTFIGRLHSIKGLDLLLHAFSRITDRNAFLIIAGSDEGYLQTMKQIIKDEKMLHRVKITGPATGETKARLFMASDVFVYPSRSEGFSLGILEAASVGLPLLITTDCHFDEVGKRKAGIVVQTSVTSIQKGLEKMLSFSQIERKKMGASGAKLIQEKYSMEAIGSSLEKIYSSLIATTF